MTLWLIYDGERARKPLQDDERLASTIEEQLYVLWELEPESRDWEYELFNSGSTIFQYGLYEFFRIDIEREPDDVIIYVNPM